MRSSLNDGEVERELAEAPRLAFVPESTPWFDNFGAASAAPSPGSAFCPPAHRSRPPNLMSLMSSSCAAWTYT